MKMILLLMIMFACSCSKSSNSPGNNSNSSIQEQLINKKWYYDSTVYLQRASPLPVGKVEFDTYFELTPQSYIYFTPDSVVTEYEWTGLTYDQTKYHYLINENKIASDYFVGQNVLLQNNQLIIGEKSTLPKATDTTNLGTDVIELIWDYYHK